MKKAYRALWILTQAPGLNWYRCINFGKYMDIDTAYWPSDKLDVLPNWEDVLSNRKETIYEMEKEVGKANIIISQRVSTVRGLATLMGIRDKLNKKLYLEIDDDVFNVDSFNPGYSSVYPGSNAEFVFRRQLEESDGVIVSTEQLKKEYKQYNKKIFVVKNCVDFSVWDKLAGHKDKNKKIKIGWQGASHHFDDLKLLTSVVPKILKKYKKKVEFHFMGLLPDFLKQDGVKFHMPVNIDKYPQTIKNLGIDIMLAPLFDTKFNRAKSNLRILEAGALKLPVIASGNKSLPYAKTIENSEDGVLATKVEEWIDAISFLIENEKERKRLGKNLYNKVKKDYNIIDTAKAYEKLLVGRKKCQTLKKCIPGSKTT